MSSLRLKRRVPSSETLLLLPRAPVVPPLPTCRVPTVTAVAPL
jgi:hypothetical protein